MLCKILKPFALSTNGLTSKQAVKGTTINVPDDLVEGLQAAGYLTPAKANATPTPEPNETKVEEVVETKTDPIEALVEPDKRKAAEEAAEAKPLTVKKA